MSSLLPHVLLVFQQSLLHIAASAGVVLHSLVVEDVCERCFDLALVVADLGIGGIGGIGDIAKDDRHLGVFFAKYGVWGN